MTANAENGFGGCESERRSAASQAEEVARELMRGSPLNRRRELLHPRLDSARDKHNRRPRLMYTKSVPADTLSQINNTHGSRKKEEEGRRQK